MLIPDLTLTPELVERLRACGDGLEADLIGASKPTLIQLLHDDGSELTEPEQRRWRECLRHTERSRSPDDTSRALRPGRPRAPGLAAVEVRQ